MLKLLRFLYLCALTGVVSCSKKSGDNAAPGTYFIKARIGGQVIRYEINAGGRIENNKVYGEAFNHPTNNFPSFSFDIEASARIQGDTTYREALTNLIFRYSLTGTDTYHSQMGNEMDFVMRLTEVSDRQFKGMFSGTVRKSNDVTASLQITEGEFVLER